MSAELPSHETCTHARWNVKGYDLFFIKTFTSSSLLSNTGHSLLPEDTGHSFLLLAEGVCVTGQPETVFSLALMMQLCKENGRSRPLNLDKWVESTFAPEF